MDSGNLSKEGEEGFEDPEGPRIPEKHGPQNQLSGIYIGSQRLKQQSRSLYGSVLAPLHICYGCIAWCPSGTPNSASGGVSDSFASPWDPFPFTGFLSIP